MYNMPIMKRNDDEALCALCGVEKNDRICRTAGGRGPSFCPTLNRASRITGFTDEYAKEDVGRLALEASRQEAECYANRGEKPFVLFPTKPRLQETWEFARRMGYRKLGLAFCAGLQKEAAAVHKLFEDQGFQVVSVVCKVGGVPKEVIGIREEEKIMIGSPETMCNPVSQAGVLNDAGVDMAMLLGLCVGHDSLFIRYAKAPVTVLAVKDRVTGHNQIGRASCRERV